MSQYRGQKLNQLLAVWPQNAIVTNSWLKAHNISSGLAFKYVKGSWVNRVGAGAYSRPGDVIDWKSGVAGLYFALGDEFYLGGISALQIQGFYDQVPVNGLSRLMIYTKPNSKLPKWFMEHDWKVPILHCQENLFKEDPIESYSKITVGSIDVRMASTERACFEVASRIPGNFDFTSILNIFAQLTTMRTEVVQAHFDQCKSIKARRIFLFLCRESGLPLFKALKFKRKDLGSGKREVVKGGRLDQEFLITVPLEMGGNK